MWFKNKCVGGGWGTLRLIFLHLQFMIRFWSFQVQYLASNGQEGASSSISKCDSSLLESMSLNFSRADQTIETFIQPPVLGNQVRN